MKTRATKPKVATPQSTPVQPTTERKVLHTPYSVRHLHTSNGGRVLKALATLGCGNLPFKVEHRPEGIFYCEVSPAADRQIFLFEESSGRLIVQQR